MKRILLLVLTCSLFISAISQKNVHLKKKDRKKDVLVQTSMGDMVFRLSDSTPLHRDNFLMLVKQHYFDSILFHRVIKNFMIQAGDPDSKHAAAGKPLGEGSPGYKVPAEFRTTLFHKKGVLAAAREGDNVNPERASSGSQFYIVKGRVFTEGALDSLETMRLHRKIDSTRREVYKTTGGTPHLDGTYTVFGEMISGWNVLDSISETPTSNGVDRDRPLTDVIILRTKLVKRKKHH